jgi:hypothetical protein
MAKSRMAPQRLIDGTLLDLARFFFLGGTSQSYLPRASPREEETDSSEAGADEAQISIVSPIAITRAL